MHLLRNPAWLGKHVTPDTLANLIAWWKADTLSGTDGDLIASWSDSSGNSRTATQSTTGNKPKFFNSVWNGKNAVEFDTDDFLSFTATPAQKPYSVLLISKRPSGTASGWYLKDQSSNASFIWVSLGGSISLDVRDTAGSVGAPTVSTISDPELYSFAGDGSAVQCYAGKTALTGISGFANNFLVSEIGNSVSSVALRLAEICIYSVKLTGADVASLYDNYFKPKYGLT